MSCEIEIDDDIGVLLRREEEARRIRAKKYTHESVFAVKAIILDFVNHNKTIYVTIFNTKKKNLLKNQNI